MQTILRNALTKLTTVFLMVTAMLSGLTPAVAYAACAPTVSFDLWAKMGTTTFYTGGPSVTIWGYAAQSTDPAGLPGPALVVNQGACVGVTLHNVDIPGSTSLLFQGQDMVPDTTGVSAGAGGSKLYTFVASDPGTFLYEAGLTPNGQHQVAMGMYGALVVRPSGAPLQAYAALSTAFDSEQVLVLSEFDNSTAFMSNPAGFDMRKYAPKYFLINGKAYPGTAPIAVTAGNDVLLRYVNAGLTSHHMGALGLSQTVLGQDGNPFTFSHKVVSETIAPGQTLDALVTIPASASSGSKFALYDSNLMLRNTNASGFGGMLTFLTVGTGTPPGGVGPLTSSVTLSPSPTNGSIAVSLNASVSDATTGNNIVSAAEYFIDNINPDGSGTAMSGTFASPIEAVNATLLPVPLLASLASGNHTIYVHGQDSLGNWGPVVSVVLTLDKIGPTTSALSLSPNSTNGTANVSLTGTASDSATGNGNITAAEYFIDAVGAPGTGTAMAINITAPTASLSATISAATVSALGAGSHTVSVRSQDALGNWGSPAAINLVVDDAGPVTSAVNATYNPNNGTKPFNTTVQAVRVAASFSDVATGGSNIAAAEGFIDTIGATGTGFVFVANDGNFNSPAEGGYANIPLVVINALSTGNHTIYVHGKDAAGNWGTTMATVMLVIERTPPTFTGISIAPNPTNGAASVTMSILGAADASGVTDGEWWVGTTNPAPGGGIAFSGLTPSISTISMPAGTITIRARVRDAAGNWSTVVQGTSLTVRRPLYFSTFGNSNPPGAGGTADDADIYFYSGSAFSRVFNANVSGTTPLPLAANVDGYDRVSATQFYLSFSADTTITGFGTVQDEDIVYYNAGAWSVYFDGTSNGLTAADHDIDAFNISGGVLYFSTAGNTYPPTLGGCTAIGGETADDADIYSWNGICFTRVWTAVTVDMPAAANVDGLVFVDATHFYLSFADNTALPGFGTVQDEDVVYYNNGVWMVYFDGTSLGLTAGGHDIDAFDLP